MKTIRPPKDLVYHVAWTLIALALTPFQSDAEVIYEPFTFTTLAGSAGPVPEGADGTGSAARFNGPYDVAVDSDGNVYVADSGNDTIRQVTPSGVVTTLAGLAGNSGSADGTGSAARFNQPRGVAVDSVGNVYVADESNHLIRKISPAGVVTTLAGLAGGAGSSDGTRGDARFNYPSGVAVDTTGTVYVADESNHLIRKVTPEGTVTTLAGLAGARGSADGIGSAARFNYPTGVAVDTDGNAYVADRYNGTIRKVSSAGVVTTLAGLAGEHGSADGIGSAARFSWDGSIGVAVDTAGNVYVADSANNTIRKVTSAGVVTTLAGLAGSAGSTDGTGGAARFWGPSGVEVDSSGKIYVAENGNNTIRIVKPGGVVTTLAGLAGASSGDNSGSADGTGSDAQFNFPNGVAVDIQGKMYVTDSGNHTIRQVTPLGVVTTLAGLAGSVGSADGTGSDARFRDPSGVAVDPGGYVFVADTGNHTIRRISPEGVVTTLAGLAGNSGSADGKGNVARFSSPEGVAVDGAGTVYVADSGNSTVRKVSPDGLVETLAGSAGFVGDEDGFGPSARFNFPKSVAVDGQGNVYVAGSGGKIRKVTLAGVTTTLAGSDGCGALDGPVGDAQFGHRTCKGGACAFEIGLAADSFGNVYVTDAPNNTIRKINPQGFVTTLAGLTDTTVDGCGAAYGRADGTGSDARFASPRGVAVDSAGNLYVADSGNNTIRKGYPAPRILSSGAALGVDGGQFGFDLTGPAGRTVMVEGSSDLLRWQPLWTNVFTFPAALRFQDTQGGDSSARFYRLRVPEGGLAR